MNVKPRYYYAGSTRVAMRTGSSMLRFLLGDLLGSTSITTDSNGVLGSEIRYHPWGGGRWSSGSRGLKVGATRPRVAEIMNKHESLDKGSNNSRDGSPLPENM